jgi:hypothetical protein
MQHAVKVIIKGGFGIFKNSFYLSVTFHYKEHIFNFKNYKYEKPIIKKTKFEKMI